MICCGCRHKRRKVESAENTLSIYQDRIQEDERDHEEA
jgi:hypothetical protein